MAEKQKSFGKKLKDLFIVEEGGQSTEASEAEEDTPRPAATGTTVSGNGAGHGRGLAVSPTPVDVPAGRVPPISEL